MNRRKFYRVLMAGMLSASIAGAPAFSAAAAESETEAGTKAKAEMKSGAENSAAMDSEAESESGQGFDEKEAKAAIEESIDLDTLDKIRSSDGLAAEDWLPIGSVVLLNDANKTLMVMARFVYNTNEGKYYEYCGCLYPEGFGESEYYFFNHDEIGLVVSEGYEDEYEKLYRDIVLDDLDVGLLNETSESEEETE